MCLFEAHRSPARDSSDFQRRSSSKLIRWPVCLAIVVLCICLILFTFFMALLERRLLSGYRSDSFYQRERESSIEKRLRRSKCSLLPGSWPYPALVSKEVQNPSEVCVEQITKIGKRTVWLTSRQMRLTTHMRLSFKVVVRFLILAKFVCSPYSLSISMFGIATDRGKRLTTRTVWWLRSKKNYLQTSPFSEQSKCRSVFLVDQWVAEIWAK